MSSKDYSIKISYKEISGVESLSKIEKILLGQAIQSADRAYAKYSEFRVGAAVLLEGGIIKTGSNQENAAYPSGLCAERVAVFSAASDNPDRVIEKIMIIAKGKSDEIRDVTPCGCCRQVLKEYENKQDQNIQVIVSAEKGQFHMFESIDSLLPFAFSSNQLD